VEERHLLGASFLVSTAGLVLLYLISIHSTPPLVKVSELTYDDVGLRVTVKGEVISKKAHKDGHVFLKIADDTGKLSIAIFNSLAENLKEKETCLQEGKEIEVTGEVEEFRGSLEVIPRDSGDVKC
jgi:DNA/RNA endonuclease YhcR with UshA esterase domain